MKNQIQSQKEFTIGDRKYVINLYETVNQKYRVDIFEKVKTKDTGHALLTKGGSVIKRIPFNYLKGA